MQFSEYQITSEEVVVKDIAELYLKIQENTQFLTSIVRHQQGKVYKFFSYDTPNIQFRSFYNLIVQTSYLLYTCYLKKVAVYFSKKLFLSYQKQHNVEVLRQYFLETQFLNFNQNYQKQIIHHFNYVNPFKSQNAYGMYVLEIIKQIIQISKNYREKHSQNKSLFDKITVQQYNNFTNQFIIINAIAQKGLKPKALISCLEQTELFQTYSYLLRILNCSFFQNLIKTGNFKEIMHEVKKKQSKMSETYNQIIRQNSLKYQQLEKCFLDFMEFLEANKIIQKQNFSIQVPNNQKEQQKGRVCCWKILIDQKKMRKFNENTLLQISEGRQITASPSNDGKKLQNLFRVNYSAKNNLLSVQYISNIQINIQSAEALLYHCNNIAMQLSNSAVQYTEREINPKKKQKVLLFRIVSFFNIKQNPFINLMLLLDRALIYGKTIEPDISKKVSKIEDFPRFIVVGKRINHLTNLFLKKIRRLYQNVAIKDNQN